MSIEYQSLAKCLRRLLKEKKLTYRAVADKLLVSEQTIKRSLNGEDGQIGRIGEISELLGLSFFDLVEIAGQKKERIFRLSIEQEQFFCDRPDLYAMFEQLLQGQSPCEIQEIYSLKKSFINSALKDLEKGKFLDRIQDNKVKLRFDGTHNWIHGGPMQRHFIAKSNHDLLEYLVPMLGPDFPKDHFFTGSDRRVCLKSLQSFVVELDQIFKSFRRQAQRDEAIFDESELISVKWLACIARRPSPFLAYLLKTDDN